MGWDTVEKARRRLSREQGTVIKDWGGRLPVALIAPNSYYLGMSNLGVHAIYRMLNSLPGVVCERAFWEEDTLAGSQVLSLESQRPLSDFAVLAFSITYELDYFNVVQILKNSNLPLYSSKRDEWHPLVIAGGPCVIANPAPLAPFFDCLCIGEAEAIFPAMLPVLAEGIAGSRSDLLKSLASLPGMYVPQNYSGTPVARQYVKNLDDFPVASAVLTRDTELGDLYLIEVERGCNWACRFCLASAAFRPERYRSIESVVKQAEEGLKYRKRLGLVGAAVTDHPQIEEMLAKLSSMSAQLSVSSLRIKPLPSAVLREIAKGTRSIALAPEAGSERLRRVIHKGITEADIFAAMEKAAGEDVKQLKLYFMIGLPTETESDIDEIIALVARCKEILNLRRPGSRLALKVSPFVPKAGTPFQWSPMASVTVLNQRITRTKKALKPQGIEVDSESPVWSEVQGVLARGDERLAEVLAGMAQFSLSEWRDAVKKAGLDIDSYVHRQLDMSQELPWSMLEWGRAEYLKKEFRRACEET